MGSPILYQKPLDPLRSAKPQQIATGAFIVLLGVFAAVHWIGWSVWGEVRLYDPREVAAVFPKLAYTPAGRWVGISAIGIAIGGLILAILTGHLIGRRHYRRTIESAKDLHGSSRWAEHADVKASGLLKNQGVYLGAWEEKGQTYYLRHNGAEHCATIGPTRCSKDACVVTPTCLTWPHSMIVNDLKTESYNQTAAWRRAAGHRVYRFAPARPDSDRGNPFSTIRLRTYFEVGDTQNLAAAIPEKEHRDRDHWDNTADAFLVAAILHVMYEVRKEGRTGSPPDVLSLLSNPDQPFTETLRYMREAVHDPDGTQGWYTHPAVAQAAKDMENKAEEERSGIHSTAVTMFSLYRDPLVARAVSGDDFKLEDLMDPENPTTLYLCSPPRDRERLKPLLRLMFNQAFNVLCTDENIEKRTGKPRLLGVLNELPSLGPMPALKAMIGVMAGYGIKLLMISPDLAALNEIYGVKGGKGNLILNNARVTVMFAPVKADTETAQLISTMCGDTTVQVAEESQNSGRFSLLFKHRTGRVTNVKRALLTPAEVTSIPQAVTDPEDDELVVEGGNMLVFMGGQTPPIYAKQAQWFFDPTFKERVNYGKQTENAA